MTGYRRQGPTPAGAGDEQPFLETLAVRYKGRSIAEVLHMRVSEALELFSNIPKIRRVLQTLADVGLDYLSLGQAAPVGQRDVTHLGYVRSSSRSAASNAPPCFLCISGENER